MGMQDALRLRTYETDGFGMDHGAGKLMNGLGNTLEQCHNLIIAPSEFMEGLRLLLKDSSEGLDRITAVESEGQRMASEVYPHLDLIVVQSRLKERFEGFLEGSHVIGKKNCMVGRS